MPQVAVCKSCGHTLYKSLDIKSADDIIKLHGGLCPKCGRKLIFDINDVEIIPLEDS